VALPVTLEFVADGAWVGRAEGPGDEVATKLTAGSHAISVVAFDSLGARASADETMTVTPTGVSCP
jgi:hypothetical protein